MAVPLPDEASTWEDTVALASAPDPAITPAAPASAEALAEELSLAGDFARLALLHVDQAVAAVNLRRSAELDRPYIAAHPLEFQTLDAWRAGQQGLLPIEATMMVALPELDGATCPSVFGGRGAGTDGRFSAISARSPNPRPGR